MLANAHFGTLSLASLIAVVLSSSVVRAQRAPSFDDFGLWAGEERLRLVRHDVQLEVIHPVVETILVQEFDNPNRRDLEATFTYPVPAGAVVTSLALWVKGERRQARLLERRKAQEIYEGIVRQKRDPALLERTDGNTFRIRIFPVLARSRARIELRFVQLVDPAAGHGYRVILRKPPGPPLHALRLGVRLWAPFVAESVKLLGFGGQLRRSDTLWQLPSTAAAHSFTEDIQIFYRAPASFRDQAVASASLPGERVFVAEIPIAPTPHSSQRMALLLDTSRSMEAQLPRVREFAQALLRRLGPGDRLALVPFGLLPRQSVQLLAADPEQRLRWRGALNDLRAGGGGSFLPAWRAARVAGAKHLVLITDGGSAYHAEELEQLLRELDDQPGLSVSTIAVPGARNEEQLQAIARQSGGIEARLERGEEVEALAQRLESRRPPGVKLEGSGTALLIARSPGRLLVAGSVPASDQNQQALLRLHTGEAVWLSLPEPAARWDGQAIAALYGSAAIEAKMTKIRLFGESPELRADVVRMSLRYQVVSEYTALLATETDADYERPVSGEPWQRRLPRAGDDLGVSSFQSTPEPREIALMTAALLVLLAARRFRLFRRGRGSTPASNRACAR